METLENNNKTNHEITLDLDFKSKKGRVYITNP